MRLIWLQMEVGGVVLETGNDNLGKENVGNPWTVWETIILSKIQLL